CSAASEIVATPLTMTMTLQKSRTSATCRSRTRVTCLLFLTPSDKYDVAVIGAGAAGLMAAIAAARTGARVVAIDSAKRIGAKILISGGGRCNVTNEVVRAADFNGSRNA